MIVGVPKEIKNHEARVAITPMGVKTLVNHGHQVVVEAGAGQGSGFSDQEYLEANAVVVPDPAEVWTRAEIVVKVKEPLSVEYQYFRKGLTLFTYLHLAADETLTQQLRDSDVTAIAYETIQDGNGLPLLKPMSAIAGRMAVQIGAHYLEKQNGGRGVLLGGMPGVVKGHVAIVGGGTVGINAAKIATGMGARVTILDTSVERLSYLEDHFGDAINTSVSTPETIAGELMSADLVIGAVLIPGSKAPKLVTQDTVRKMRAGAVIVDVAVDQGGIFETVDHVTTHENPIYFKHDVIHYAVSNMPGAVPRTSTLALTNASLPYLLELANKGLTCALRENQALLRGLNVWNGHVTYQEVANTFGLPYTPSNLVIAE